MALAEFFRGGECDAAGAGADVEQVVGLDLVEGVRPGVSRFRGRRIMRGGRSRARRCRSPAGAFFCGRSSAPAHSFYILIILSLCLISRGNSRSIRSEQPRCVLRLDAVDTTTVFRGEYLGIHQFGASGSDHTCTRHLNSAVSKERASLTKRWKRLRAS